MLYLQEDINISFNNVQLLPSGITTHLPKLKSLIVTNNKLEDVPADLANIENLDVRFNPLSEIPPVFRDDMKKVLLGSEKLQLLYIVGASTTKT